MSEPSLAALHREYINITLSLTHAKVRRVCRKKIVLYIGREAVKRAPEIVLSASE